MAPRGEIMTWLSEIVYDKSNIVCILSNQSQTKVEYVFDKQLKEQENFWLTAESGYWLKTNESKYQALFEVSDRQWIKTIRKIMDEYCQNIDGSVVQERSCSIMWNYTNTEREHGAKSANELELELRTMLGKSSPIEIIHSNGYIEVLPSKLTM
jgi:trehalose-6-phosphatase